MPRRYLPLTAAEEAELCRWRDTAPKPWQRERAAALLKIAAGQPPAVVARTGLLKPRDPDTVYAWLDNYLAANIPGVMFIRPGRGRKPAFSPQHPDAETAREHLLQIIHQDPATLGQPGTRWTLARLRLVLAWQHLRSVSGLSRLCRRLKLSWKRARAHVHSPDPAYAAKRAAIARIRAAAAASGGRVVCVYVDEVTLYRQPTLAQAWAAAGPEQAQAERSHRSDTKTRVIASLDPTDGRVVYLRASKIGVNQLVEFLTKLRAAYPGAERIYVIWDNWPVHVHPDLLVALEAQTSEWQPPGAPNWGTTPRPTARRERGALQLPIQLVWLPTYASWLNPIEKLWRKLQQEEIHLHRLADDLEGLRQRIDRFLTQFAAGSRALLYYVGLLVPN